MSTVPGRRGESGLPTQAGTNPASPATAASRPSAASTLEDRFGAAAAAGQAAYARCRRGRTGVFPPSARSVALAVLLVPSTNVDRNSTVEVPLQFEKLLPQPVVPEPPHGLDELCEQALEWKLELELRERNRLRLREHWLRCFAPRLAKRDA